MAGSSKFEALRGAQDSHGTAWATHAHAPRTPYLTRTTAGLLHLSDYLSCFARVLGSLPSLGGWVLSLTAAIVGWAPLAGPLWLSPSAGGGCSPRGTPLLRDLLADTAAPAIAVEAEHSRDHLASQDHSHIRQSTKKTTRSRCHWLPC